jgi:tRNA threonylcarbamoyladenosine biosynthesis protein TsaE
MSDIVTIWLPDPNATRICGRSLARTLYRTPITIALCGEIGAGKTTFLQGFAEGLGVSEAVTSPTFALEQRYPTSAFGEFLHIDCYRLAANAAAELIHASDEHRGIRCIEWPERLPANLQFRADIEITIKEEGNGRRLTATFQDIAAPSLEKILEWRKNVLLPPHIAAHCDGVGVFAERLANVILAKGFFARPKILNTAGKLHDLLRFLDFSPDASPAEFTFSNDQRETWAAWRTKFPKLTRHEPGCALFLEEHGFSELGQIIAVHGLRLPVESRRTIDQQLLYYADKRVCGATVVSLDERFKDFRRRYGKGKQSEDGAIWYAEAKAVEESLFGGTPPS